MRRSPPSIAIVMGLLALALPGLRAEAQTPPVQTDSVDRAPFTGESLVAPVPGAPPRIRTGTGSADREAPSLPSASPEKSSGAPSPSLGNLYELRRQEALLKREIRIRKLKEQLKGKPRKKVIETGGKGTPMTLLAAGLEGRRFAVLSWPDGRRIRVRQGETLPDGSRVLRIDGSGVSVSRRGSVETYPFGETPVSAKAGGYPAMSGFMPTPVSGGRP